MKREGVQLDSFWEDLEELDNEMDFSDDIDEFLNNEYEGTYYGKYNSEFDDREMTPEYHEALKRAEEKYGPTNASDYRSEFNSFTKKRKFVEEYLFRHLIEENWEGYKLVYEKWLEIIKKK